MNGAARVLIFVGVLATFIAGNAFVHAGRAGWAAIFAAACGVLFTLLVLAAFAPAPSPASAKGNG